MTTLLARCLIGLANGFGGGFLGGLVYYGLTSWFTGHGASFPYIPVLTISAVFAAVDMARLSR